MAPTLLIVAGPTGAGKTRMTERMIQLLNLGDPAKVLVDDLVQADKLYHERIRKLLHAGMREVPPSVQKSLDKLYYEIRTTDGCNDNNEEEEQLIQKLPKKYRDVVEAKGCGRDASVQLFHALSRGENVVFEYTGSYYPSWLLRLAQETHKIVIAYAMTDFKTLLKRNHARVADMLESFYSKTPGAMAPRLPDMSESVFERRFSEVRLTLLQIVAKECVATNNCDGRLDGLYVFNTTKRVGNPKMIIRARMALSEKYAALRALHKLMIKLLKR